MRDTSPPLVLGGYIAPLRCLIEALIMSKPDADFTVAVDELRQVADTISQGANFFESQIIEGLPVARCIEDALRTFRTPSHCLLPLGDIARDVQCDRQQ